jgi:hypothetical protein
MGCASSVRLTSPAGSSEPESVAARENSAMFLGRLTRPRREHRHSPALPVWRLRALQAAAVVFATVLFASLVELMFWG